MGFSSNATYPVGTITLSLYLGEGWKALTIGVTSIVVITRAFYKAIFGRSTLNSHRILYPTYHQLMKFPTSHGIGVVRGNQPATRNCYMHSVWHLVFNSN